MRAERFFSRLMFRKKAKERKGEKIFFQNAPSYIRINNTERIHLAEVASLSDASSIKAEGKWESNDFRLLGEKIKIGLPAYSGNSFLLFVDLGGVKFLDSTSCISFMKLFSYCTNLTHVILPDASTYKGAFNFYGTFQGCVKLREITNLETYLNINNLSSTFCYCYQLEKVTIFTTPFPTGDKETFHQVNPEIKITIPHGSKMPSSAIGIRLDNVNYPSI